MIGKKRPFIVALMMAMMLSMAIITAGCAAETEETKEAVVETESGWTIGDDGSYTYACVIKNTSEDKIISTSTVTVDGLDADGNAMEKVPEWDGASIRIGPIMPGEKAAAIEERTMSEDPMSREWEETPAAFSFKVIAGQRLDLQEPAAKNIPNIHIVSAEQTYNEDDSMTYEVVLENKGEEDVDIDFTDAGGDIFNIIAVFRDEDGKITGGSTGVLNSFENVITFPAGEEVVYSFAFSGVPKGEPELILTWN